MERSHSDNSPEDGLETPDNGEGETNIDFIMAEDGLSDGEWSPDGELEIEEIREGLYNPI
jgi:hypothetical protein